MNTLNKILLITLLLFTGCGSKDSSEQTSTVVGEQGPPGPAGESCTVEQVDNGALITCGETTTIIYNGTNGQSGTDGINGQDGTNGVDGVDGVNGQDGNDGQDGVTTTVVINNSDIVDPCGDLPNAPDQILYVTDTSVVTSIKHGKQEILASLEPGIYQTTDAQKCNYEITSDYQVIDL